MPDAASQPVLTAPDRVFVISGPSGVGKNTLLKNLEERGSIRRAVTATTRKPRKGEEDGRDYYFVSPDTFNQWVQEGRFLEHARYCGNSYGTPIFSVNRALERARAVVLEIEVQGAMQVKESHPQVTLIFIAPPSEDELRSRLAGRGDEDDETLEKRMRRAREEMEYADEYDRVVVNDTIERSVDELETLILSDT